MDESNNPLIAAEKVSKVKNSFGEELFCIIAFTGLAGSIYPLIVGSIFVSWNLLSPLLNHRPSPGLVDDLVRAPFAVLVAWLAFGVVTWGASMLFIPLTYGTCTLWTGLMRRSTAAAISGGNVAALFTSFLFGVATTRPSRVWPVVVIGPVLAIFVGQLGGRFGQWRALRNLGIATEPSVTWTWRFTLRQLFALTTAICLATASLRILATWNWQFAFCLVCAVLTQIVLLPVTNFLASRLFLRWQRRAALPEPSGEPHPP